jgi:hypothetical protein
MRYRQHETSDGEQADGQPDHAQPLPRHGDLLAPRRRPAANGLGQVNSVSGRLDPLPAGLVGESSIALLSFLNQVLTRMECQQD